MILIIYDIGKGSIDVCGGDGSDEIEDYPGDGASAGRIALYYTHNSFIG